jgi:hypothetical protein
MEKPFRLKETGETWQPNTTHSSECIKGMWGQLVETECFWRLDVVKLKCLFPNFDNDDIVVI